ncbi:GGDEF domain-containing protein [Shewanella hanedai]|uniref:EAL domain-containing protein n=1 Tax=Shewanella hanedai TaxID=25 RepID=A0A553JMJ4_SHEHA|nr:EAL domain-containing protein [Shewanella hanedai]TRY13676.1 EAL domain-containing protein [Shewanella hanedai]GGI98573.1 GGDEF domain-containing protein [Shewanella hanedai]
MSHTNTQAGLSLKAQLYALVVGIAIVSFIGSSWININTTRNYLNEQMEIHAQDTATSLGLSITPYLDGNSSNAVIIETMIAAIFDSGYYETIILHDVDEDVVHQRANPVSVDGVPDWFIDTFSLNSPLAVTELNNGWNMAGTLSVKSHPGYSYFKLWKHGINNFLSSFIICLLSLFIAHLILRAVLRPLAQVEQQAVSVGRKQFSLIDKLPMTRELRTVITAMNTMVTNIQISFMQMSQHADKLNKDLYVDPLTQLGNRRAFESQFKADLVEMEPKDLATFGMIQLPSLKTINIEQGYKSGDAYICLVAQAINEKLGILSSFKLFRGAGGTFLFTTQDAANNIMPLCESLHYRFSALNSTAYPQGFGEIIATSYTKKDDLSSLLSKLDTLLTQESSTGKDGVIYSDIEVKSTHGLRQWSSMIDDIATSDNVKFMFQPVKSCENNEVLYFELFPQFVFNQESIANNQLYAMAERLNKSTTLDKKTLKELAKLSSFASGVTVAINLTHQSLHDVDFRQWLSQFHHDNQETLPNIVFEVSESAILASVESSIDFIHFIKHLGCQICIEHFGSNFTSFKYLKGLDIDYLKIDGAFIRDLDKHPENRYFIQAVTQIGHSVGIKVLSPHVKYAESLAILNELHCDGVQGDYIQQTMHLFEREKENNNFFSPSALSLND